MSNSCREEEGEEVIAQQGRDFVSFFEGDGHSICFIYTTVNYSDEIFGDGDLLALTD